MMNDALRHDMMKHVFPSNDIAKRTAPLIGSTA
jgi:hypothetical protein